MSWITDPEIWASFLALSAMEIVLGIDNIIFISLLIAGLPDKEKERARAIGLGLALAFRVVFLITLAWLAGLTATLFTAFENDISWRDIVLIAGGLFLLVKATLEIHHMIDEAHGGPSFKPRARSIGAVIAQIILIDIVFSVDSVVTAVGMARHVPVMVAAILTAMIVMYVASGPVARFVSNYPTTKMLALSFLLLVGIALVADGLAFHIPRGYIYFAMAFAVLVEFLNITVLTRRRAAQTAPVAPPESTHNDGV